MTRHHYVRVVPYAPRHSPLVCWSYALVTRAQSIVDNGLYLISVPYWLRCRLTHPLLWLRFRLFEEAAAVDTPDGVQVYFDEEPEP